MHSTEEQDVVDWDFETLMLNWHKSLLDPNKKRADKKLSTIEEEWQYREVDIEHDADYPWEVPTDGPNQGLLSALGYQVGITQDQPIKLRHKILLRVVTARLPIVHSHSYMLEWGRPATRKRKVNLVSTISRFIEQKYKYDIYDRAIKSWAKDLCMLERHCHSTKFLETTLRPLTRLQ